MRSSALACVLIALVLSGCAAPLAPSQEPEGGLANEGDTSITVTVAKGVDPIIMIGPIRSRFDGVRLLSASRPGWLEGKGSRSEPNSTFASWVASPAEVADWSSGRRETLPKGAGEVNGARLPPPGSGRDLYLLVQVREATISQSVSNTGNISVRYRTAEGGPFEEFLQANLFFQRPLERTVPSRPLVVGRR